ncbi:MAG: V-type ATP synthase subunit B, partial [Ignisphaera sp.]
MSLLLTRSSREIVGTRGSLLFVKALKGIKYGELVEIDVDGDTRLGQVIDVSRDVAVVQVFGSTAGISPGKTIVRFKGEVLRLGVSIDMMGRIFDGLGNPIDGGPPIVPEDYLDIHGEPLNPALRIPPSEPIETGVSVIDGLLTLVRGQKLPIFSGSGLPHNRIAMQIVRQAAVRGGEEERFAVVFGAVGVAYEEAYYFLTELRSMGALDRTIAFIAPASASTVEKLALPRVALTAAENLAWRYDMHVLTILTDMTNYCEALREVSAAREEVPGRRGYPGYMYTD